MRRMVLALLVAALVFLLAARTGERSDPAAAPAAAWDSGDYNVLQLDRPGASQTAGSSLTAGLDAYFLARRPTAKNERTGALAGRNLVLLLAEDWQLSPGQGGQAPALERLWTEGARFPAFYAPDWYQGPDGREFALLSGVTPTAVGGDTALAWAGEQGTSLPFALGNALSAMGYTCRIYPARDDREAAYGALGFVTGQRRGSVGETVDAALTALASQAPFAACFILSGTEGEQALTALWRRLEEPDLADATAVCLVAGSAEPMRGTLLLWGGGTDLTGTGTEDPCSELDVTPTLLNLLGAAYDARFLFGRDLFAQGGDQPVSLYGSAYSDWVAPAGGYRAATASFTPADGSLSGGEETARYVQRMRQQVYERYVCAQQAVESNYFRLALDW